MTSMNPKTPSIPPPPTRVMAGRDFVGYIFTTSEPVLELTSSLALILSVSYVLLR